jgi:hypothetical protein
MDTGILYRSIPWSSYHGLIYTHIKEIQMGEAMTTAQEDLLTVLNTAMLAILVIMNLAWHYGYL